MRFVFIFIILFSVTALGQDNKYQLFISGDFKYPTLFVFDAQTGDIYMFSSNKIDYERNDSLCSEIVYNKSLISLKEASYLIRKEISPLPMLTNIANKLSLYQWGVTLAEMASIIREETGTYRAISDSMLVERFLIKHPKFSKYLSEGTISIEEFLYGPAPAEADSTSP